MDDDSSRAARQRALAEKKRRLEEIKARRRLPNSSTSVDDGGGSAAGGGKTNLDSYIDDLLKGSTPGVSSLAIAPPVDGGDDGVAVVGGGDAPRETSESSPPPEAVLPSSTTAIPGDDSTATPRQIPTETFDVAIQCCAEDLVPPSLVSEEEDDEDDGEEEEDDGGDGPSRETNTTMKTRDEGPPASSSSEPTAVAASPSQSLSPDERSRVLTSRTFAQFLSDAGRRVERLLGAGDDGIRDMMRVGGIDRTIDFGVDHANDDGHDDDDEDGEIADGVSSGYPEGRRRRRNKRGGDSESTEAYRAGGHLVGRSTYEFPRFTRGRAVTDVEWCPGHAEWMAVSYGAASSSSSLSGGPRDPTTRRLSPLDPPSSFLQGATMTTTASFASSHFASSAIPNEGIVAIYNLSMPNRPEHLFCAGCPILRCRFHPTEGPRLVVGGGSSGQVLVWDARAGRYPVQRSSVVGGGHDRELVGMRVLGGDGVGAGLSSSMLVTASIDGRVNYWSASNLREPADSVVIDANLSCLEVLHGVTDGLVCGDERGGLHAVLPGTGRDGTVSSKRVVRVIHAGGASGGSEFGVVDDAAVVVGEGGVAVAEGSSETGHYGVVTGITARNAVPALRTPRTGTTTTPSAAASRGFSRGLGGLLVTTGVDWSTKLWAPAHRDVPLTSFLSNSYDYMCDAQWSPVHPSIFATASSNGTINIWNLAITLDQPVSGTEGIPIDGGAPGNPSSSSYQGLNRLQWSSDGRRLAVASGDKLHVLSVGEHAWKAKGDEEGRVMHNLISRGLIQQD
ncbi:hypothetical protein ACHAXA_006735 [Cyclostephanos tholiformis]|uniref:Uncharacterized protein n=1 Tax=Cyclostephanos tholiformis TaxID=382380 RepID=A0ABD3SRD9_9STRA